ncbi:putative reverse transcriptase domain-containing protein, partial [Tanacetum coccineum]
DESGCLANQRVKYVASSFIGKALIWWNTQVQARGRDAANAMSWNDFKALLTTEFCPSNEIEKLEGEFWNHSMVGADHAGYTDRFHELAKLVPHLIRGMLRATQAATIQAAILTVGILTDEAVRSVIEVTNGKKEEVDRIFHGCRLELGDSMFLIGLIPLGQGSFDVIVGMDWLSNQKAVIVCHEKIVKIPVEGGKVLYVQ